MITPSENQLSQLTTMQVGGSARVLLEPADATELANVTAAVWSSGEPWLILGGGSNLVIADDGFDGTVVRVSTRGIEHTPAEDEGRVRLRVQAGESWDDLVAHTVEQGLAGIEALSGIPGSVGAAPIQNIGAYGQEFSDTLVAIDFLDYLEGEVQRIPAAELQLGYRTSAIKQGRHGLVVAIELELTQGGLSTPIAYAQLADSLSVDVGERVPVAAVRSAVLSLRASKGMVLSAGDPDSVSAGSFFTNPIVSTNFASALPADAPRWSVSTAYKAGTAPKASTAAETSALPETESGDLVVPLEAFDPAELAPIRSNETQVKLSAAWLIERSGIRRGFALPGSRAAISSKHTLAIVNTGSATAEQVAELARYVQSRVASEFGVILQPEPMLVGVEL